MNQSNDLDCTVFVAKPSFTNKSSETVFCATDLFVLA